MTQANAEQQSLISELTAGAMKCFAEDVTEMFDIPVSSSSGEPAVMELGGLREKYKQPAVVCSVKASGTLNGPFFVIFDKPGSFVVTGTFLMQPEQIILENIEAGTTQKAQENAEILSDLGGTIAGAWKRAVIDKATGEDSFVQAETFVGNPWSSPEEVFGIDAATEVLVVQCEMNIEPLPKFECSVIYPVSIFEPASEQNAQETELVVEETGADEIVTEETAADETAENTTENIESGQETIDEQDLQEGETAEEGQVQTQTEAHEDMQSGEQEQPVEGQQEDQIEPAESEPQDQQAGPVATAIRQMVSSDEKTAEGVLEQLKDMVVTDVMLKEVVWAKAEDAIEQVSNKLQQSGAEAVLVGQDGRPEGIIVKSDIRGALSPYLQPMLAKWKGPMDIATLQIKAKWVMSKPVRTVRPDTSVQAAAIAMSEHGVNCMPVVDEEGKVHGVVSVMGILRVCLGIKDSK